MQEFARPYHEGLICLKTHLVLTLTLRYLYTSDCEFNPMTNMDAERYHANTLLQEETMVKIKTDWRAPYQRYGLLVCGERKYDCRNV